MNKEPNHINFSERLKFGNKVIKFASELIDKARISYLDAEQILNTIKKYDDLSTVKINGIEKTVEQMEQVANDMQLESNKLLVDNNRFVNTELHNEVLVREMLEKIIGVEGKLNSNSNDDVDITIQGVYVEDFAMFTSMTPIEYFEYMRSNGGAYGVDQGCLSLVYFLRPQQDDKTDSMEEISTYYTINDDYEHLIDYLQDRYGFSRKSAIETLGLVDSIGACSYASIASIIEYEYRDKPERFEANFGFPLYRKTNLYGYYELNSKQLLLDLYVFANTDFNKPDDSSIDYNVELLSGYMQERDSGVEVKYEKVFDDDINFMGDNLSHEESIEKSMKEAEERIQAGENIIINMQNFSINREHNDQMFSFEEGHSMYLTDVSYNSDYSQMCAGVATLGERAEVTQEYIKNAHVTEMASIDLVFD